MKPHPRIRRMVKGGATVASLALLTALIGSRWWAVRWLTAGGRGALIECGRVYVIRWKCGAPTEMVGVHLHDPSSFQFHWWFATESYALHTRTAIPLWPLVLAALAVALIARRLDVLANRVRDGRCRRCTYDLAGLPPPAVCPECGTP